MEWKPLSFPNSRDVAKEVARKLFTHLLEKRGCEGVDGRLRRFLVPPQRRSDYTDIQMKAAPSGSGRNSYVSSNYSNFLSQNSRRKLPRSLPPRRKRNRQVTPTSRRFATKSDNLPDATLHDPPSSAQKRLSVFPSSRGAVAKSQRASSKPAFPIRGIPPFATRSRGWYCVRACATISRSKSTSNG